jgi:hypothetical protein
MRIKEKLLILFVAIFMSFAGFNLIASSYAGQLDGANDACYETTKSYLAKGEVNSHQSQKNESCSNSQRIKKPRYASIVRF